MLKLAAERTAGLLRESAPFVHQKSRGDFIVTYAIIPHGVQIMTPACEGDPKRIKVTPKAQWFTAPAAKHSEIPGDKP